MTTTGTALHPDRLLPAEPGLRGIARELYESVRDLPIVSPHGHVDPALLAEDRPFTDPASLLVTPDHYVTRLLHAHGVGLDRLGLPDADGAPAAEPRTVWREFCAGWRLFLGTASRGWISQELSDVLGVTEQPCAENADALFDQLVEKLAQPQMRPRELFRRFRIETLATTDDPADDLRHHRALAADPTWDGRVVPTFRPDRYLDATDPGWSGGLERLGAAAGVEIRSYDDLVDALQRRRAYFREHGATATDHSAPTPRTRYLPVADARRLFDAVRADLAAPADRTALSEQLLGEMARMSADDGMVMALHCGVRRNHHPDTRRRFGPDTGHDIPLRAEFTEALRPMLERFGTHPSFRTVLFTLDESVFSREIAPLAGFYPSVYAGAPWWFLDAPRAMARARDAMTETAGFFRGSGFIDDTRGFCSIPARHDTARRVDAGWLAGLVAEHVVGIDDAYDVLRHWVLDAPRTAFKL